VQGPEGFFVRQLHAKTSEFWQLSLGIHSQPAVQIAGGRVTARAAGAAGAGIEARLGVAGVATGTAGVAGHCGQGPDGLSLRQLQATSLVSLQLSFGTHSQPFVQDADGDATATGAAATGAAAEACGTGGDGASTGATAGVAGCPAAEELCGMGGGMGAGPDGVASGNAVPSIAAGAGATFGSLGVLVGFEFAGLAAAALGTGLEPAVGAVLSVPPAGLGTGGLGAAAGGGFGTVFNTDVEPNAPYLTLEKVTDMGDCLAFA